VAQDVPEQEDQDAGGHGIQETLDRAGNPTQAADRETDEDRHAGNQAEDDDRGMAHLVELVGAKITVS